MEQQVQKVPFIKQILRGIGQIMLQRSSWTGLLFLTGIVYDDWRMGVGAVLATVSGTLSAHLLKFDKEEIEDGLYGFSPALVGVAMIFLFEGQALIWALIVVGGSLAAMVQHFFIVKKIPVYTLPFILVTWVITYTLHQYSDVAAANLLTDNQLFSKELIEFTTATNGFGEVIFQGSFIAGLLFFIAVFISNPIAAIYGLAGSIIAAWVAAGLSQPLTQIHMGIFSFNAVLCAIVFSGTQHKHGILVLIASLLSVLIEVFLIQPEMSLLQQAGGVLTFPFVVATWLTLPLKKMLDSKIP